MLFGIINMFFVPFVGAYIYLKRNKGIVSPNIETLMYYVCFTIANAVAVKLPIVVLRFFRIQLYSDSSFYTAIAIVSVIILAFALEIVRKAFDAKVEIEVENEKQQN